MVHRTSKVVLVFRSLLVWTGLLAGHRATLEAAEKPSSLDLAPPRALLWLGPLSPQGTKLPAIPSPLRSDQQVWTVSSALVRALQSNPDIQVALATVQRQDGVRVQVASALFPRISASGSIDQRDRSLIDRSAEELARAGNPLTPLTIIAERSYSAQIELRQTLFDGFASWHQVRRAALLEKKASVDARELYLRIASQIRQAYDTTILRQTIVQTRRDAVRDLSHLAGVGQKRFAAGEISEFESLRAQTALRSAEADLAQAEADVARAEELFCRILYIERPASGLRLVGQVQPLDYKDTLESALSRAKAGRLDLRSAALQLDAANMAVRIAGAGFSPRVEGFVNYGLRSSYYDDNRHLEGWTVGAVVRWDIFESGQTVGLMRAQRAERRIAEIRLAEVQHLIGSQVRELFAALAQAKIVIASHASARDLGERSKREAIRQYEVGRASQEQVLNAELAYRQSLVGWLSSVYNHNLAIYQLDYATADETFLEAVAGTGR